MCTILQTIAMVHRVLNKAEISGYGLEEFAQGNKQPCFHFYFFLFSKLLFGGICIFVICAFAQRLCLQCECSACFSTELCYLMCCVIILILVMINVIFDCAKIVFDLVQNTSDFLFLFSIFFFFKLRVVIHTLLQHNEVNQAKSVIAFEGLPAQWFCFTENTSLECEKIMYFFKLALYIPSCTSFQKYYV